MQQYKQETSEFSVPLNGMTHTGLLVSMERLVIDSKGFWEREVKWALIYQLSLCGTPMRQ